MFYERVGSNGTLLIALLAMAVLLSAAEPVAIQQTVGDALQVARSSLEAANAAFMEILISPKGRVIAAVLLIAVLELFAFLLVSAPTYEKR